MKRYTFHRVTSPVHSVIGLFPLFALSKIWAITCNRETLLHSRTVEVSTYLHSVYKPMLVAVSSHLRSQTTACLTAGQATCPLYCSVVLLRLALGRGLLLNVCSVSQCDPFQVGNGEGSFFRTSIRTHRVSFHIFLITTLLYHSTELSLFISTDKLHFVH